MVSTKRLRFVHGLAQKLQINDAGYVLARGEAQVIHRDLPPRTVRAVKDTVAKPVFMGKG